MREITELKAAREQFLEETTVLNARNEELAQLGAQYTRRMEAARSETPVPDISPPPRREDANPVKSTSFDRPRPIPEAPMSVQHSLSASSTQSTNILIDDREIKANRPPKVDQGDAMSTLKHGKFIKWPGSRTREPSSSDSRSKMHMEHNFQQASTLRFTRCDHCGDKLWGSSQFRCSSAYWYFGEGEDMFILLPFQVVTSMSTRAASIKYIRYVLSSLGTVTTRMGMPYHVCTILSLFHEWY